MRQQKPFFERVVSQIVKLMFSALAIVLCLIAILTLDIDIKVKRNANLKTIEVQSFWEGAGKIAKNIYNGYNFIKK